MLTRLRVRNFKRFEDLDIELGDAVVLVGPNNSGKTTALQALALWQLARDRWLAVRGEGEPPKKRPGITINRRDLVATPVPDSSLLWRARRYGRGARSEEGKKTHEAIHIEVIVDGVGPDGEWTCGFEIIYDNEESFRCKPLGATDGAGVAAGAKTVRLAFLPPMAGLVSAETRIDRGAIDVRIGEGRTSEVLRNLCHLVAEGDARAWVRLVERLKALFGVTIDRPTYDRARGEITLEYADRDGIRLDLGSAGRGLLQTLLLFAYLEAVSLGSTGGAVLLLDEPDAHLEILRQRDIYGEITRATRERGGQIIAATHSEVILNEAGDRDVVVAFVGTPHRIDDRGKSQALTALRSIGFEHYYQAERRGWVLYLEGATDLGMLRAFATTLAHPAAALLRAPFVQYVMNQPKRTREHFFGLQHAKPDLVGIAVYDKIDAELSDERGLRHVMWRRRELENYLCQPVTLLAFARADGVRRAEANGPIFEGSLRDAHERAMQAALDRRIPRAALDDLADEFWTRTKASDDILAPIFGDYYRQLSLPNLMNKSDYHTLAPHVPRELLDAELGEKLDAIVETARNAAAVDDEPA